MAVPKNKKGRARTHARRSANSVLTPAARSVCPQCGEPKLPHYVCANCGYYDGREIIAVE
ncbi:MAG: 50S ribosomal protein L32 [Coriobacteriales bacterium]|jgi:large subunit ribosomal protein L32|nr:50S ribosomal protein L32 [Coriobacteriales bacterium]